MLWSNPLPLPSIDPQWGWGITHARQYGVQSCEKCEGTGMVGRRPLQSLCPRCEGQGITTK